VWIEGRRGHTMARGELATRRQRHHGSRGGSESGRPAMAACTVKEIEVLIPRLAGNLAPPYFFFTSLAFYYYPAPF
jgi:hypothetical protein